MTYAKSLVLALLLVCMSAFAVPATTTAAPAPEVVEMTVDPIYALRVLEVRDPLTGTLLGHVVVFEDGTTQFVPLR
jgi:hypothetical protein